MYLLLTRIVCDSTTQSLSWGEKSRDREQRRRKKEKLAIYPFSLLFSIILWARIGKPRGVIW